jgi:antitoxin (DNA-binding transcriptional repressor) of toxin-antitoxin stability system
MTKSITVSEAQDHMRDIVEQVAQSGETIVLEVDGRPMAMLVPIDQDQHPDIDAYHPSEWVLRARRSRERIAESLGDSSFPSIDDVFEQMREERDAQLLNDLR